MASCSGCGDLHDRVGQRYCVTCHAAYMRAWRVEHRLSGLPKVKANARSYAGVYQRRGKITRKPCEVCGSGDSQKHHDDYSKPLEVRWLCRAHHLELHAGMAR